MGLHEGRVVWVTGAASGIGRATTEELAAEGASILATDLPGRDFGWATRLANVVTRDGDAASEADNEAAVAAAVATFGALHGAVFNAGLARSAPLLELPMEDFDRVMAVNVRGIVLGIRAVAKVMTRGASIVTIASTSGLGGDAHRWAYNTSKGAVVNLTRALAIDLGSRGIRVNAVCPGPTETGMTERLQSIPEANEGLQRRIPLGRWGQASEQAAVVSFLLSTKASFVNGVALPVDGGITASTGQFDPPEPER